MIRLRRFAEGDWPLLVALNAPEMTEHLGGPETDEALRKRYERYLAAADSETVFCYTAVLEPEGVAVGNINFWEREWEGTKVYEMGWGVVPEYQGRGLASEAVKEAIELARATGRHDSIHAFPSVENGPSNAICRKAGFELVGPRQFEYPKGHWMECNDWRFVLRQ
ncbi:MAG TPA: GNAT family N-acetyltransferase [Candidatus Dormibacteraeota bacterium]|nr:GNAT family N-acetyltransferase [Candidatus Dormibacteraeota bacterium]